MVLKNIYFMCMGILSAYMSMFHVVCVPHACLIFPKARRGHWIPWTGVTEDCKFLGGSWELNPGPLEEQAVFLTDEPSL